LKNAWFEDAAHQEKRRLDACPYELDHGIGFSRAVVRGYPKSSRFGYRNEFQQQQQQRQPCIKVTNPNRRPRIRKRRRMSPKALIAARVLPKLSIRKQGFLELVPSVTEQSRHGPVGQTVFLDNLPSSFSSALLRSMISEKGILSFSTLASDDEGPPGSPTSTSMPFAWISYLFK